MRRRVSPSRSPTGMCPAGDASGRSRVRRRSRASAADSASTAGRLGSIIIKLADLHQVREVVDTLLHALGARERFGRRPSEVLLEHLAGRRLLLVLDNCEHLLAAVGGPSAELLGELRDVQALVTSREPLESRGRGYFRLGPLGLPSGSGVGTVVHSTRGTCSSTGPPAADAGFALTPAAARAVARICHQLDGLPLALCLAAARVGASERERGGRGTDAARSFGNWIAADRVSPHQHSVRASFDWSYQLLEARERELLRWLSVFAGGFTVVSAHAVAGPLLDESEVRRLLDSLESKGLIMAVTAIGAGALGVPRDSPRTGFRVAGVWSPSRTRPSGSPPGVLPCLRGDRG